MTLYTFLKRELHSDLNVQITVGYEGCEPFFHGMTGDLPARYLISPHNVIRYKTREKGLVVTVKNPAL